VEEDTAMHLERWRIARFGHRVVSHEPSEWCRYYPFTGARRTRARSFLIKKLKTKYENTKTPLMTLLIIQNTYVKIQKYPQRQIIFFVFSKVKNILLLYMESEKT
jgi:hypothetical protein